MKQALLTAMMLILTSTLSHAAQWDGGYYRKNSSVQYDVTEQVLSHVDNLPANPVVLDVGCGDGRASKELIQKYLNAKQVVGIDPSQDMLTTALSHYQHDPKLDFKLGSFQNLNEKEKYDIVTTFFSLHWVPKEEQARSIANMAQALKPQGLLIAAHVMKPLNTSIRVAIHQCIASAKRKSYFPNYIAPIYEADPYELQQNLTQNKLRLLRFVAFEYNKTFESNEQFYEWASGWSPYKKALGDRHHEFWMDVITAYRIETKQNNTQSELVFKDPFIEIVAQKI
jgi:trans-aconitate methyltransferase